MIHRLLFLVLFFRLYGGLLCVAQESVGPTQRIPTPNWNESETRGVFYENAFAEALDGTRPLGMVSRTGLPGPVSQASDPAAGGLAAQSQGFSWSTLVSRTTLEDEVKRLKHQLDASISQPVSFAGKGHQEARRQFASLAAIFAIVHRYDKEIRWKSSAAAARDRFAFASSISKVGTLQTFNASKRYKSELSDLVRGSQMPVEIDERGNWTDLIGRSALMHRLETAQQDVIGPGLASTSEMKSKQAAIIHEAEVIAAFGQLLLHEGMPEWDDPQYVEYCEQLKRGAAETIRALRQSDYDAAVEGAGVVSKSCSNCHDDYRG